MKPLRASLVAILAFTGAAEAIAQPAATYNRKVRQVAVVPDPANPAGWLITCVFTVEATLVPVAPPEGIGVGLDNVGTTVLVRVNSALIGAVPFDLQVDPSTLGGPCGGTCGSGVTNGMTAAMLCIDGVCQFPPITANVPVPSSLMPADVIEVILIPAPGSLPDSNTADDAKILTFAGNPVGWNRRVSGVSVAPSPPTASPPEGPGSFFDITVTTEISSYGTTEQLRLGARPLLLVNGSPVNTSFSGCDDWIAAPNDLCQVCTLFTCGSSSCAGQNVQLICRVIENDNNLSFCGCVGENQYVIPGVQLLPGDEVMVLLRPAPGALPELPGFGDDDKGVPPAGCVACAGDLNGDGIVDGVDVAALLNNFGICFPQ